MLYLSTTRYKYLLSIPSNNQVVLAFLFQQPGSTFYTYLLQTNQYFLNIPSTDQAVQEEVEGGVEGEEEMVEMGDTQPHRRDVVSSFLDVAKFKNFPGNMFVNDG